MKYICFLSLSFSKMEGLCRNIDMDSGRNIQDPSSRVSTILVIIKLLEGHLNYSRCYFPCWRTGIACRKSSNLTGFINKTSVKQFLMDKIVLYQIYSQHYILSSSLINAIGIPFSWFDLENVSFSSQQINLKHRSPAGSGKKDNALPDYLKSGTKT